MKPVIIILCLVFIAVSQVFCPVCKSEKRKSTIYVGSTTTTCLFCGNGYYDTLGIYHAPLPCNTTTTKYHCSNGHEFVYSHESY